MRSEELEIAYSALFSSLSQTLFALELWIIWNHK